MSRLRYNGLSATLGASLTTSGTAVTFAAALTHSNGTSVPTLTGNDYIALEILDSNGHLSELVYLTAYTSGGTTGTIVRGQEGTSGVTHATGDKVTCGALASDLSSAAYRYPSLDLAVTRELSSLVVHRWKFDDASGTTVADSVGSLPLTMSGTYTRHVTSLTGFGTTFGASAVATSSGLGSIPTGGNDRCIIVLYRSTSASAQSVFDYGAQTTRNWFSAGLDPTSANNLKLTLWSDDLALPAASARQLRDATSGPDWNLAAFGYVSTAQNVLAYQDGSLRRRPLGGALATTASGNFRIGGSANGAQFLGDIDDVIVLNAWPGKAALDRLLESLAS